MRKAWIGMWMACNSVGIALAQGDGSPPPPPPDSSSASIAERYYVSPMASYVLVDGDRETKDGIGGQLALGAQLSSLVMTEVIGQYSTMDTNGGGSADLWGVGVNGLFFPTKGAMYGLAGFGYGRVDGQPGDSSKYGAVLINLGLGYLWKPLQSSSLLVRAQAEWRLDAHNGKRSGTDEGNGRQNFSDAVFSVGVVIPIGRKHQAPEPAQEPVDVVPVEEVAAPPEPEA